MPLFPGRSIPSGRRGSFIDCEVAKHQLSNGDVSAVLLLFAAHDDPPAACCLFQPSTTTARSRSFDLAPSSGRTTLQSAPTRTGHDRSPLDAREHVYAGKL